MKNFNTFVVASIFATMFCQSVASDCHAQSFSQSNNTLYIHVDKGDDQIRITPHRNNKGNPIFGAVRVDVNGDRSIFYRVHRIDIDAGRSANEISVDDTELIDGLSIVTFDGNDTVRIVNSHFGSLIVDSGDGDNIFSIGKTTIERYLIYHAGDGDDSVNFPYSPNVIGQQADCIVGGTASFQTTGGDDWVEIRRFHVVEDLFVNLGIGNDYFEMTSSDTLSTTPRIGEENKVEGWFALSHNGYGNCNAIIEDIHVGDRFSFYRSPGPVISQVTLDMRSRELNGKFSPLHVGNWTEIGTFGSQDTITIDGLTHDKFGRCWVGTHGVSDSVSIKNTSVYDLTCELGNDDDHLMLENVFATNNMQLDGGFGNNTGNTYSSAANGTTVQNFKFGNLSN